MSDDFCFTERIRTEEKYFDVSLSEVERTLTDSGRLECTCEHHVNGGGLFALKLNLYTRSSLPTSWSAALKLNRTRIDGIDHESRFRTADRHGEWASGWHRHQWDRTTRSAERHKCPLPGFGSGQLGIRDFVLRVASELRIRLNSCDHGL